jgi:hypothetical protein
MPIIRIHPRRIISFGIDDPDHAPHELVPNNRDVTGTSPLGGMPSAQGVADSG